jgi:hypothetical protein
VISAALRWVGFAAVATVVLLIARFVAPGRKDLELDIFVLVLGGLGLLVLASELRRIAPPAKGSPLEEALEPEPPEVRPIAELHRLERELSMAAARQFDLDYRLRPILREVAEAKLERHGLSVDSGSPAARELLGDELWELVAGDDHDPLANRLAPGPGLEGLERTISRLERL